MKKKSKSIYNILDYKDSNGLWVMSHTITSEDQYTQYHTRSSRLWHKMNDRCRPDGNVQKERSTYIGCKNVFNNYQDFTDWCQSKFGYLKIDTSGKYWDLDKDVKFHGNKIYSPDNCLFVPHRINTLVNMPLMKNQTSDLFGVHRRIHKFSAECKEYASGRVIRLGSFSEPIDAHRAWQVCKAKQFITASKDPEINKEISLAMEYNYQRIMDDWNNHRVTV